MSNPLTKGLAFVFNGRTLRDLKTGLTGALETNTSIMAAPDGSQGIYGTGSSPSGYKDVNARAGFLSANTDPLTIIFRFWANSEDGDYINQRSGSVHNWSVFSQAGNNRIAFRVGGTAVSVGDPLPRDEGKVHTLAIVYEDGSTNWRSYWDAAPLSTGSNSGTPDGTDRRVCLLTETTDTFELDGGCIFAGVWQREMSEPEVLGVMANPWQIFKRDYTIPVYVEPFQIPAEVEAPASPTGYDAISQAKMALRQLTAHTKAGTAQALNRLGLRPSDAANKTTSGDAVSRLGVRPTADASKTGSGDALSRFSIRTLVDYSLSTVVNAVSYIRMAFRPTAAAEKDTSGQPISRVGIRPTDAASKAGEAQPTSRIGIRPTDAASKTTSGQPVTRISLRSFIAGVLGDSFNAVSLMRLALKPTTSASKAAGGTILTRLGIRASSAEATVRTSQALQRLGFKVGTIGQVVGEFNGVAVSRLALRVVLDYNETIGGAVRSRLGLRPTDAGAKSLDRTATSRLGIREQSQYDKASAGTGISRIALRQLVAYAAGLTAYGEAHSKIMLRALSATTPGHVGVAQNRLATRIAVAYVHTKEGLARSGLAIRPTADGEKDVTGIGYNRFGLRVSLTSVPQGATEILHLVELQGVFDPDRSTSGLFDLDIPLEGTADNP